MVSSQRSVKPSVVMFVPAASLTRGKVRREDAKRLGPAAPVVAVVHESSLPSVLQQASPAVSRAAAAISDRERGSDEELLPKANADALVQRAGREWRGGRFLPFFET